MSLNKYILYISIYGIFMLAIFFTLVFSFPGTLSLVQWDAHWFIEIARHEYSFSPDKHSSVAFFPLLPWLIRLLNYHMVYLPFIAMATTAISLRCLSLTGDKNSKDVILFLSSPLVFYFFVPYAEFLFLFGSALILLALQKRHIVLLMAGAFVAILSRYAAMILVPALLLSCFYEVFNANEKIKSSLIFYGSGILSLIAGLTLVSYIQYMDTGVWNGYQQTHFHWGHALRYPTLPFYSAMGSPMLLLDQVALLISILSAVALLLSLWYRYKKVSSLVFSPIQFLSLCYLAGSGASMIAFQGGSLDSLGRYVFATAFIFPLFSFLRHLTFKPAHLIYVFLGSSAFFFFTGSQGSVFHLISNEIVAFVLSLFYGLIHLNKEKSLSWNYLLIFGAGIALQTLLFLMYLRGEWVE